MPGIRQRSMTPTSTTPYPFIARKGLYLPKITAVAAAPPAAWTPASISGVLEWWDFSDTSKITASGGAVSAVATSLPSGGHPLVQGTSANQPITGTRTINLLNGLDFDGTDDYLTAASGVNSQIFTVLAVFDLDSTDKCIISDGNSGAQTAMIYVDSAYDVYAGTNFAVTSGTASTNPEQIIAVLNGASSLFYLNGVSKTYGSNPGSNAINALTLGWDALRTALYNFDGIFGEYVLAAGAISASDRTSWNTYVARWGL